MRRISANYIFTCENEKPLKNGIIEINNENIISQVIENLEAKELASTEFFNGIIVPLFVSIAELSKEERKIFLNKEKILQEKDFFHISPDKMHEFKEKLKKNKESLCLGINYWGGNYQQEIFSKIKFIQQALPYLKFGEILKWATINNALELDIADDYGSICVGKKAAFGLIYPFDFKENKLKTESKLITNFSFSHAKTRRRKVCFK